MSRLDPHFDREFEEKNMIVAAGTYKRCCCAKKKRDVD